MQIHVKGIQSYTDDPVFIMNVLNKHMYQKTKKKKEKKVQTQYYQQRPPKYNWTWKMEHGVMQKCSEIYKGKEKIPLDLTMSSALYFLDTINISEWPRPSFTWQGQLPKERHTALKKNLCQNMKIVYGERMKEQESLTWHS